MFYCPKCRCKVNISINVYDIPADYSINILTNALNLALSSLGNFNSLIVDGFTCPHCYKKYSKEETLLKSQITGKYDVFERFIIISVKNKKDELIDGKVVLVIPPKIIHKEEIDLFNENYNPYKDKQFLIVNSINKVEFITPK